MYPLLQSTVTLWVVVPVILPELALSELVTLPAGIHVLASHVCAAVFTVYPTAAAQHPPLPSPMLNVGEPPQ